MNWEGSIGWPTLTCYHGINLEWAGKTTKQSEQSVPQPRFEVWTSSIGSTSSDWCRGLKETQKSLNCVKPCLYLRVPAGSWWWPARCLLSACGQVRRQQSWQTPLCSSPRGSTPWQPSGRRSLQGAVDQRNAGFCSATSHCEPLTLRTVSFMPCEK